MVILDGRGHIEQVCKDERATLAITELSHLHWHTLQPLTSFVPTRLYLKILKPRAWREDKDLNPRLAQLDRFYSL